MSHKTPQKSDIRIGFSPVLLRQSPAASPKKNLTGPPRIIRDLAADLYNTIQKWNNLHIQGCQIVKQIGLIKSEILGSYSRELEEETDKLYKIVQSIIPYSAVFKKLSSQMCALEKLQNKNEVLFISCTLNELKEYIKLITNAYIKELTVKEMVLENIAHSRNKDELMFFAASWTLQPFITKSISLNLEALLVETGHHNYQ